MNNERRPKVTRRPASAVYSAQDIADMLGINLNRVYSEAAAGNLPCLRYGRRFVFPRVAVDRFVATAGGAVEAA